MFPNGKHDDRIDACSRAFASLVDNRTGMLDWLEQQVNK